MDQRTDCSKAEDTGLMLLVLKTGLPAKDIWFVDKYTGELFVWCSFNGEVKTTGATT